MAESYEEHIPCTRQVKVSQSQLSRLSLTPVPAHIHIILFFFCVFIDYCRIIEDVTGPVDINTCNTLRPCVPASQEAYAKRKWAF